MECILYFGLVVVFLSVLVVVWYNIVGLILVIIWLKNVKNEKNIFSDENVLINIEK